MRCCRNQRQDRPKNRNMQRFQMTLQAWRPFGELRRRYNFNTRFGFPFYGSRPGSGAYAGARNGDRTGTWQIPLDIVDKGDELVVSASVPGIDPTDIKVNIDDGVLTIWAETPDTGPHRCRRVGVPPPRMSRRLVYTSGPITRHRGPGQRDIRLHERRTHDHPAAVRGHQSPGDSGQSSLNQQAPLFTKHSIGNYSLTQHA